MDFLGGRGHSGQPFSMDKVDIDTQRSMIRILTYIINYIRTQSICK